MARKVTYKRPWLYPKQKAAIFCRERYGIVEASTKSGKTAGCMIWLAEQAMQGKAGRNYWWVAPILAQAEIVFQRLKLALPRELYTKNDSKLTVTIANGAVIWFKGADHPDTLYGEDVYAAVIDEASRCKEGAWHAVRTTLTATGGPIRIIGNVKGRRNWAYMLARKAEAGAPNMHYAKIRAADAVAAGIIPVDEVADAQRLLPAAVFRELYEAEPSDDEGNPFGISAIDACIAHSLSTDPVVAWGWDLAKSHDWTVGVGLDADHYVAQFERFQQPWEETIRNILARTNTGALVDSTGVGDPVLERLQRAEPNRFEGFKFTSQSKQQLMEGLAVAIQQRQVRFPAGPLVEELKAFEYVYTRTGVRYCVAPDTRVLTDDLRWVPAGDLRPRDGLTAFDEHSGVNAKSRNWRRAVVRDTAPIILPSYRIGLSDGTSIVASNEHQWLVQVGNKAEWRKTSELREHSRSRSPRDAPSRLMRLTDVWDSPKDFGSGYLAAAWDGEGSIHQSQRNDNGGNNARLSFAQRENEMARQVRRHLRDYGFEWSEYRGKSGVKCFGLTGRRHEFLRFLGQIRPARLLAKFDVDKLGTLEAKTFVNVETLEFLGDRALIALGTSTATLITEGFASHNSAPEGLFDDAVCALALAVQKAGHRGPVMPVGLMDIGANSHTEMSMEQVL